MTELEIALGSNGIHNECVILELLRFNAAFPGCLQRGKRKARLEDIKELPRGIVNCTSEPFVPSQREHETRTAVDVQCGLQLVFIWWVECKVLDKTDNGGANKLSLHAD